MNFLNVVTVVVAFIACLALANASGGYEGPSATVLQGPSSKATLVGPEGSVISAVAPGGQIFYEEHPGVVAHAAVAHSGPIDGDPAIPSTVIAHSSAFGHNKKFVVVGPSGVAAPGSAEAHDATNSDSQDGQYVI